MRALLDVGAALARGGGRREALGALMAAVAVAVSVAIVLLTVAADVGLERRADREAWRQPVAARGPATALQARGLEFVRGRPIVVVDLARLRPGARVPPGLGRFPAPGEVWLSPALRDLVRELPPRELADRYAGGGRRIAGTIGPEGLTHRDELVGVVGHRPGAAALTAGRRDNVGSDDVDPPTRVDAAAAGRRTQDAGVYLDLARILAVLVVVPLLVLAGAAARLTAARRDRRLATMRLLGATPGQVVALTVAEAAVVATVGAGVGALLYGLAIWPVGHVPTAGGPWLTSDLWVGAGRLTAVCLAAPLLVTLSATLALAQVVIGPLGVVKRRTPRALRRWRIVALVAAVAAYGPITGGRVDGDGVALGLLLVLGALTIAGPWCMALIGRACALGARRPALLLGARRLTDDPRAAWRTVGGITLAVFVAGVLASVPRASELPSKPEPLLMRLGRQPARDVAAEARERLARARISARVTTPVDRYAKPGTGEHLLTVTLARDGAAERDRARTALAGLGTGIGAATLTDADHDEELLVGDARRFSIVLLIVAFLTAAASAGITACSGVLDRRRAFAQLRLIGAPLRVLDAGRRWETILPLALVGGGAGALGIFAGQSLIEPDATGTAVLQVLVAMAAGGALVLGASALSRPLLRRVSSERPG